MKERIKKAFTECENDSITTTSVIFVNRLTEKISFFNGITEQFENIPKEIFNELFNEGFIEKEYFCQGETRYVMHRKKKRFLVTYYENYSRDYEVEAYDKDEAIKLVQDNLMEGNWDSPNQCYDSGIGYVEELLC